jgi:hypothetical protein
MFTTAMELTTTNLDNTVSLKTVMIRLSTEGRHGGPPCTKGREECRKKLRPTAPHFISNENLAVAQFLRGSVLLFDREYRRRDPQVKL